MQVTISWYYRHFKKRNPNKKNIILETTSFNQSFFGGKCSFSRECTPSTGETHPILESKASIFLFVEFLQRMTSLSRGQTLDKMLGESHNLSRSNYSNLTRRHPKRYRRKGNLDWWNNNLARMNHETTTLWLAGWWQLKYFLMFIPKIGEKISNLTGIFF